MNPIVNPWLIYLADSCTTIKMGFLVIMAPLTLWWFCKSTDNEKVDIKVKVLTIVSFVLFLLWPTTNTVYKMGVVKYITPDNITAVTEFTGKTFDDAVEGITESVKEILDYSVDKVYEVRNNKLPDFPLD